FWGIVELWRGGRGLPVSALPPPWRPIRYLTTAEAHREGWMRWFMNRFICVPVRRYRPDPISCRETLRLLSEGDVVCLFVERERSILGNYQGCRPEVARILPRLPFPVIPVAVMGGYDIGPRWSSTIRRGSITVCVRPPIDVTTPNPAATVDQAIKSLLVHDPQPVRLDGLDLSLLKKTL
ncbi:MAG: 1-acyl-sn-glycerol-3-phosphate acyltransferase, partial [Proteobacteria bacterium]|nr:1-acyl-sn-glycerol-3-phosphate acyltransferase [Pseudomonadota bacterium]